MNYLWLACLLLVAADLTSSSYPPTRLQRLARLVLPYVGSHTTKSLGNRFGTKEPSVLRKHANNEAEYPMDAGATDFEDEDGENLSKRQFDDYGHMRFGRNNGGVYKRYDDYGHMRYGK